MTQCSQICKEQWGYVHLTIGVTTYDWIDVWLMKWWGSIPQNLSLAQRYTGTVLHCDIGQQCRIIFIMKVNEQWDDNASLMVNEQWDAVTLKWVLTVRHISAEHFNVVICYKYIGRHGEHKLWYDDQVVSMVNYEKHHLREVEMKGARGISQALRRWLQDQEVLIKREQGRFMSA
jgi:hypothetical protein